MGIVCLARMTMGSGHLEVEVRIFLDGKPLRQGQIEELAVLFIGSGSDVAEQIIKEIG